MTECKKYQLRPKPLPPPIEATPFTRAALDEHTLEMFQIYGRDVPERGFIVTNADSCSVEFWSEDEFNAAYEEWEGDD